MNDRALQLFAVQLQDMTPEQAAVHRQEIISVMTDSTGHRPTGDVLNRLQDRLVDLNRIVVAANEKPQKDPREVMQERYFKAKEAGDERQCAMIQEALLRHDTQSVQGRPDAHQALANIQAKIEADRQKQHGETMTQKDLFIAQRTRIHMDRTDSAVTPQKARELAIQEAGLYGWGN